MEGESILITGGTGFIGSHLARKLVRLGHRVILFDVRLNNQRIDDIADLVELVEGSVTNSKDIEAVIQKYEVTSVFHTAAQLSVAAATQLRNAFSVNIEGTFNLLEACRTEGVKKFIFISSLAGFGPETEFPFHAKSYRDPASFYGVCKVSGEVMGNFYAYTHGLDFRCVRFAVVIGPGRRGQGATVSFSKFVEEVVLGQTGTILVPDYTVLPIVHIDDATELLIHLWQADRVDQRIFMSGGVPMPIQDFVDAVKDLVPDAEVVFDVDPEVEEVASTWTLMTTILVNQGKADVFREIDQIGWKLRIDSIEAIAKRFVDEVTENREMYGSF